MVDDTKRELGRTVVRALIGIEGGKNKTRRKRDLPCYCGGRERKLEQNKRKRKKF